MVKKIIVALIAIPTFIFGQTSDKKWLDTSLSFEKRINYLVEQMTLQEKISQLVSDSPEVDRLEVPEYNWWNEALHGIARNGKATVFPQAIGLAATFDTELAQEVANAISDEARAKFNISQSIGNRGQYAGLTFWTPNVNIFRDPRWGRGQETYGEDPYLTSKMGVAFVKGLQGNHQKYLKSAACAKHYAVHSGPEELRHHFNASPSKKDLYETYLPAFEALVKEGNVEGVMSAYNAVYGSPAGSSKFLLKDLLRDEWRFNGYIVSDCGALGDIYKGHKVVKTQTEAAALALEMGLNLNCGYVYGALEKAIKEGLTTEKTVDKRLKELLMTRFKLGLFDPVQDNPYNAISPKEIHSDKHIALARKTALKSIVLLKNDNNTLPLSKDIKVPYVTGPFAASNDVLLGSYYGMTTNLVSVLEGISEKVSLGTSLNYRMGALPFTKNVNPKNWAPNVAKTADAVIAVVGLSADFEGEEVDAIASPNKGDKKDLKLPQNQIDYVKEMAAKKKGPLILVVASGSAVSLGELYDLADAIVLMWYPGEQGGHAVADVLFGDESPSGHLPITFPKSIEQLPAFEDYSMKGRTYKYMEKEPLFPFGFGLSYTNFTYKNIKVSNAKIGKKDKLKVSCTLVNKGKMDSDDVAQLYLVPVENKNDLPKYRLLRFKRLKVKSQSSETVSFELEPKDLYQINQEGKKVWIKGKYKLVVANALPSKRSANLGATVPISTIVELK
ncbi:glycoside hydrolase family 3 C-terminal domain-containing protein [Wenyingzhuangia sp. 2_MG-2023]|uniref:glycoside hydrolase family 3 C-terminal domain-containing protein n=1 Tax=Wenyingzhuangia sp. 2_MG-2023 TaxID=3062639 RepID=UPI0026E42D42|nr:glycoside hydrolase family 3 C-terminal domain-containing protein [Wenyingzhuangia sp. 2_MG-2023]MDO6736262.1 glycoside hydrolase family 3 C-terminal domain-containing protein [Wenyingzhuangia sp. 2_MG-2023]